jgi:hypothetical protein
MTPHSPASSRDPLATRRCAAKDVVAMSPPFITIASPGAFVRCMRPALAWLLLVASCTSDRMVRPPESPVSVDLQPNDDSPLLTGTLASPQLLDIATYDGSNQVVHPDLVAFATPWHGQRHWLAITPYPNSQSQFENPSLYVSERGGAWEAAPGVVNPIARTSSGYLSDPDLVYNAARDELWLYYREDENQERKGGARHMADNVYLTTSGDGVHWTPSARVLRVPHRFVVSPTIVRREEGEWSLWMVDAGKRGCDARGTRVLRRRSSDGMRWSRSARVALDQPGYVPWHIDVEYVPARGEYWALVAAYRRGASCMSTELFLATSADGTHWTTYPSPVLQRGAIPQFRRNVYRSTFSYDAATNDVTLWFTGAAVSGRSASGEQLRWSGAVSRTSADALLARVARRIESKAALPESPDMLELARTNAVP